MYEAIRQFHTQFAYEPSIQNGANLNRRDKFIVCGMGGSHLAAGLLKAYNPQLDLLVHRDYGLPRAPDYFLKDSLVILSSYSGNTEEVIDSLEACLQKGLNTAVLATGGKLLEMAKQHNLPFIQMPAASIQPRSALGLSIKGLCKLMNLQKELAELAVLTRTLDPTSLEGAGKNLASRLKGYVPVIYSSTVNYPIAYNWKIKFNETGKIPAFCNVFPELNHNEMTGFDAQKASWPLMDGFYFLILRDQEDGPRLLKRMEILEKLYKDRSLPVEVIDLGGRAKFEKIFSALILADWTAYYTAELYGLEPEQVPMVEEFKKLMAG